MGKGIPIIKTDPTGDMKERTFLLLKPDVTSEMRDDVLTRLRGEGLTVTEEIKKRLTADEVSKLYPQRIGGEFEREIVDYMTSREVSVLMVEGDNAIVRVRELKGKTGMSGLRKDYAQNFIHNSFHCPDDKEGFVREVVLFIK